MTLRWTVELTEPAAEQLVGINDRRVQQAIVARLHKLEEEPDKQGKPLVAELAGYRSVRTVGQRYRIIYRLQAEAVIVLVVAVGIRREGNRRDVYELARKLLRSGLLEPG